MYVCVCDVCVVCVYEVCKVCICGVSVCVGVRYVCVYMWGVCVSGRGHNLQPGLRQTACTAMQGEGPASTLPHPGTEFLLDSTDELSFVLQYHYPLPHSPVSSTYGTIDTLR